MGFLNPYMLWGMLAVALPVIIHFWYQKKGKQIAWAASQWLVDKTSLRHRGIRIDEIPLLLIRCLLVILLSMLLSGPILNQFGRDQEKEQVHLVQADPKVTSNFRFELENALQRKERVVFISADLKPLADLTNIPETKGSLFFLQQNINSIVGDNTHLNLYLLNNQDISRLPKIVVPGTYKLYAVKDSAQQAENPLIGFAQKTGRDNINVLIDYENQDEAETVQAGLEALKDVFEIPVSIDRATGLKSKYDWIFTDKPITLRNEQTLYVIPQKGSDNQVFDNVISVSDSLRLATSAMVQNGQLPEWLGEMLITHYQLDKNLRPLSQRQLESAFGSVEPLKEQHSDGLYQWLLLLFVLVVMLERWISLNHKTARNA
ncbi:BatA domain-containing protein [Dyadobacter chenhuakuii]|uniref:BatA domain-containing protein n=1 Tax=Dyadobacter chenhuakuii TaxID=2909339 RepID=A0ABY4XN22_9BACT|nr:BatA domain-containing protein [Dyadobacter chenhuakuii]MCF2495036.1 BatA domain-containing protein [Dyadobacter chenhuakuii]USJ31651.1 BatA domain-containing protein [Dyadobacter chenhuakuii]